MANNRDILPADIKPLNYNLSLSNLQFSGDWRYDGIVQITSKVQKETDEITLNVKDIQISSASVDNGEDVQDVTYDEKNQRATIKLPSKLNKGNTTISIRFQGTMNDKMAGFYRARYQPTVEAAKGTPKDDKHHYMFSTQFEACDARRAFPCFDEPNLKASFEFEVEIPEDLVALSNMPEKSTSKGSKPGLKRVSFDKSPVMSTYLYAWAVGDFTYVEAFTERKYNGKNMPVRVYTTRGLENQGKFALEHAHKTVDYFSDIFDIEYPLPKSDLLAVHEFAMGAMENWGLVTYRTTAVLFDEEKSDARYKQRVAYVVAHELAHQWFGNLVTMDWWSELWLNEGFATWVGWLAVDHIHPEWKVWSTFVAEGYQTALSLDSLRSSHPIEVPVKSALDIDQIFDTISYLKGSSVIRMLSNHLTVEIFLKGVSNYLKAHSYGNATTDDLWLALSGASGQDVKTFMDPWIRKIGFPVVTIAEEPGQISIRQSRFIKSGNAKAEEDETLWWVPVGLKTGEPAKVVHSELQQKQDTIRDVDDAFYKINADQTGFYRTNYPPQRLTKLAAARDKLSVEDKVGVIGDAAALAISGDATTTALLSFVEGFQQEQDYVVWSQIQMSLAKVRAVFSESKKIADGLKKFTLKLSTPAVEKIGWEFPADEDFLTGQLRKLLLAMASGAGHEGTIKTGKQKFESWKAGDSKAINQNLRSTVFNMVVANGGKDEYEAIKNEYRVTQSVDGKEVCLVAMGRTKDSSLAQDLLNFVLSDEVPVQDCHNGPMAVAANNDTRGEIWKFLQQEWDGKMQKVRSSATVVLDRWIKTGLNQFSDREIDQQIQAFFKDKDVSGFDRSLAQASDNIEANARYKERDHAALLEWLEANGYA
ncbi:hypothetical protein LTR64_007684 [Lithohypha guttulata]|uniref:uncharacterized protein n=1 Tax=Lithohypha guttulata TaxID=1690604 RepID=UPI002DDFA1BF|nr:hypothetical protein LTR51_007193 [Lithohypha guttulata]